MVSRQSVRRHKEVCRPLRTDDSRTALQLAQAESYITILRSVGRSVATSPTHGSSSASTAPSETENCKSRIETMNQLIGILKRNMRVRYDLGIPKVIEAYVIIVPRR